MRMYRVCKQCTLRIYFYVVLALLFFLFTPPSQALLKTDLPSSRAKHFWPHLPGVTMWSLQLCLCPTVVPVGRFPDSPHKLQDGSRVEPGPGACRKPATIIVIVFIDSLGGRSSLCSPLPGRTTQTVQVFTLTVPRLVLRKAKALTPPTARFLTR